MFDSFPVGGPGQYRNIGGRLSGECIGIAAGGAGTVTPNCSLGFHGSSTVGKSEFGPTTLL